MPEVVSVAVPVGSTPSKAVVRPASWTRRFYVAVTLLLLAMVVAGFWPSWDPERCLASLVAVCDDALEHNAGIDCSSD